jgi:hypothetical protein
VRLRRDDGGVVYINGAEVFRSNMPTGAIAYATLASAGTASETEFYSTCVSPSVLVAGQNSIAVEVHQNVLTSSDTTMDLILVANAPAELPTVAITAPVTGTGVDLGATVTIAASAADPDCSVDRVEFYDGATLISTDTTTPYTAVWTAAGLGPHTLTAKAIDSTGLSATTNVIVTVITPPEIVTIVNSNAVWKYLDNGTDQGTAWTGLGFNDSGWPFGPAVLGYGDANGVNPTTVVSYGPNASQKYTTTYFRHSFTYSGVGGATGLVVRLQRDDGGVVYINGTEVFRSGMSNAPAVITYQSFATITVGGADEATFFPSPPIALTALVTGQNVIAVEIHQDSLTSSDIAMNLQLQAIAPPGAVARLQIVLVDQDGDPNTAPIPELRWSAAGFVLIQSSDITLPRAQWQVVQGAASGYRPPVVAGATRFYALRNP